MYTKKFPCWTLLLAGCIGMAATVMAADVSPAPGPRKEYRISPQARAHWAFQPLKRPAVGGGAETLDSFIAAQLKGQGLSLSSQAPPRDLIRRVYFDLTGLPPAPSEVESFVADPSRAHYEAIIERLLASPHYGERWGRHWLDLARYTESTGFEYDRLRDNAWPYRDYVIKSFNDDKPYDRFMQEQIAGDVLEPVTAEGMVAASLLVSGPYDQAGNAQANATQRAITREEEMEDMLSVVGQTFLGLTINCARCHDHKFDPIPLTDYYRIKSVFDGVKHGERSLETPQEARQREEKTAVLARDVASELGRIAQIEAQGAQRASIRRPSGLREIGPAAFAYWNFEARTNEVLGSKLLDGAVIQMGQLNLPKPGAYLQSTALPKDVREKTLEAWVSLADLQQGGGAAISLENSDGTRFDAIVFGERQPRKWTAGSEGFSRTRDLDGPEETTPPGSWIHVAIVYRSDNSVAVYRNGVPYGQPYTPSTPLQTYKAGDAHVVLGLRHKGGGRPWLTGAIRHAALYDRALNDAEVAASFRSAGLQISIEESLTQLTDAERATHASALARAKATREEMDKLKKPRAIAYAGTRVQPPPTRVLVRGDVTSPGEVVAPGGLMILSDAHSDFGLTPEAPEAERRRKFAAWLADPRNPLPARVMANRIWQFHFGQGLVATPSDFGLNSPKPIHPELLDWLAVKLVDSGWSVKALHRLILNSATYRQASHGNSQATTVDADNRYFWRFAPRRLEAEAVRDAILFVSGQINPQIGGPSFRPFTTTDFNATFYHPFDRGDAEYNRRTVYRMNVNSGKEPLLDVFDCPDPSVKTPRRGVTTTPLQALSLMNSSFVQRQSTHLANRAMAMGGQDLSGGLQAAYQLALGRGPSRGELERDLAAARERGLASVCWALLNSTEFVYLR